MRPDKLQGTSWSRTQGSGLVHYVVREVRPRARSVTLVAVLDGSAVEVSFEALRDRTQWEPGWRGGFSKTPKNPV